MVGTKFSIFESTRKSWNWFLCSVTVQVLDFSYWCCFIAETSLQ